MSDLWMKLRERAAALTHPVIAVGLGLIALQLIFRAWAVYPSWFYADDHYLLYDATHDSLSADYLLRPYDSQFMPLGRFVAWMVVGSGRAQWNWASAATGTLVFQSLASLAFLWMLATLFGRRWGILAPLALYLSSALTIPAFMWWAASLNQLPLQIALPVAVGAWVRYLRTGALGWLGACVGAVGFGLLAYVKAILIVPLLAYLMVTLFCVGGPFERVRMAVRFYWPAGVIFAFLGSGFTAYYVAQVPSVVVKGQDMPVLGLAESMLGNTLPAATLGGPIWWASFNPPVATAAPPDVLVSASWVMIALFIIYLWLTRERTGRVWIMVSAYALGAYLVLLTTRAPIVGPIAGAELRYLTDVLPVIVLGLAMAAMPVRGALEPSAHRADPFLTRQLGARTAIAATVAVSATGMLSTVRYIDGWHHHNPGADYFRTAAQDLANLDDPAFAPQVVPASIIPGFRYPYNSTDRLLTLGPSSVDFPEATDRLLVLDESGHVRRALIQPGVVSEDGPVEGCGWRISDGAGDIPLTGRTFSWDWWMRIGYLSSDSTPVTITTSTDTVSAKLQPGVNSLYVRIDGSFDEITISGLDDGVTLCVDAVEVGNPFPGGSP